LVSDFWTSGNDYLLSKSYKWCVQFNKLAERSWTWKTGEPSFKGNCVSAQMRGDSGATVVTTDYCSATKKFICEVRLSL